MIHRLALLAAMSVLLAQPLAAGAQSGKQEASAVQAYALPATKPVSIAIMPPEVDMAELRRDGPPRANAAWTATARRNLAAALRAELRLRNVAAIAMDEQITAYRARAQARLRQAPCQSPLAPAIGPPPVPALPTCTGNPAPAPVDAEARLAEHVELHREVVEAILAERYGEGEGALPARRGVFAFTLGHGARDLGEVSGANYGLFLLTRDEFADASPGETQARGRMGCILGLCASARGRHDAYISLVELETGRIVWFNLARGSKADARQEAGARQLVQTLLARMPTRPGEMMAPPPVKRRGLW